MLQSLEKQKNILDKAYQDFSKGLYSRAYFKLHVETVSLDVVQDTFLKTWKFLVKGGKIESMKAFLYHILNHLIIDEYRKHHSLSLDVLLENGYEPGEDESARFIDFLDGKRVMKMIKFLPAKYKKIITMRYAKDLSLEEMSMVTKETKNSMAVQVHRGLEKLRILCVNPKGIDK